MTPTPLLIPLAALAGALDAVAGGGGLLILPALLATGLPPIAALGVNKLQSTLGTTSACLAYMRGGHLQPRAMAWPAATAFIGALLGAGLVQAVSAQALSAMVPILLIGLSLYLLLAPSVGDTDRRERVGPRAYGAAAAGLGFYDGLFGPGAGAFYAASLTSLRGFGLLRATAATKLMNLASNLAALCMLAAGGRIHWGLGLGMGLAGIAGAQFGSRLAMRLGARLIRPLLVAISLAITVKLLLAPGGLLRRWLGV